MAPSVLTPVLQRLDCRICPVASTRQAVGHQRQEINRRRAPIREGDAPVSRGTPNWTAAAPTAHLTCLSNCPLSTQPQQCPRTYEPYIGRWNRRCVPQRGRTRGVPRQAARRVSPRLRDTWPQSENPRVVPAAPGEHRRRELYALAPFPKGYRSRSFCADHEDESSSDYETPQSSRSRRADMPPITPTMPMMPTMPTIDVSPPRTGVPVRAFADTGVLCRRRFGGCFT